MEENNFDKKLTEKEIYEKDKQRHITYINEQYKPHNLELVKSEDIRKLKTKKFFSGILTGIFIFLGLGLIAGSLIYLGYGDKLKSEIICQGSNLTCSAIPDIPSCPVCPATPDCKLSCSNFTCPIVNIYVNSS